MVEVVRVTVTGDLKRSIKSVKGFRKLPKMTRRTMREWGEILVRETKGSAKDADIDSSTGGIYGKGIRWEQRGNIGKLMIRQSYVFLDSMKPHFVTLHGRRKTLLRWARQARNPSIRKAANSASMTTRSGPSIYVRPHPFIRRGYKRARRQLQPLLKKTIRRSRQ